MATALVAAVLLAAGGTPARAVRARYGAAAPSGGSAFPGPNATVARVEEHAGGDAQVSAEATAEVAVGLVAGLDGADAEVGARRERGADESRVSVEAAAAARERSGVVCCKVAGHEARRKRVDAQTARDAGRIKGDMNNFKSTRGTHGA